VTDENDDDADAPSLASSPVRVTAVASNPYASKNMLSATSDVDDVAGVKN